MQAWYAQTHASFRPASQTINPPPSISKPLKKPRCSMTEHVAGHRLTSEAAFLQGALSTAKAMIKAFAWGTRQLDHTQMYHAIHNTSQLLTKSQQPVLDNIQ
jgi:flagellar biogenesis protein FliO